MPRDYKTPLFQHRHYEWLAEFARKNLTEEQKTSLVIELRRTNCAFDQDCFLKAASEKENRK